MRLEGGLDPASGSVEYCRHRIWGRVCREGWDISDARVVCRQLQLNPEGRYSNGGDRGFSMFTSLGAEVIEGFESADYVPLFVGSVDCSGFEQFFNECLLPAPPTGGCTSAAVSCTDESTLPSTIPHRNSPSLLISQVAPWRKTRQQWVGL